jgi:hypothetical protein
MSLKYARYRLALTDPHIQRLSSVLPIEAQIS